MKLGIAIDPGVQTGFAVMEFAKGNSMQYQWVEISTMNQTAAQERVKMYMQSADVFLTFEDAQQREWYGKEEAAIYNKIRRRIPISSQELNIYKGLCQGSGSVRRSSQLWAEFCAYHQIPFQAIRPMSGRTKKDTKYFRLITGWEKRTSSHARDAGMLLWINRLVIGHYLFP